MKPFSALLTIVLGLVSLSFIVWVGRYGAELPKKVEEVKKPEPTANDLPMPKSGPYGKAEIAETLFDFGTKLVGTNDEHTFTIKNAGAGNLDFKLGKPTCQCTGVEITKSGGEPAKDGEGTLAPGESIDVQIKWQMKARMEKFRHGAPVFTTDPDQRKIELFVTGAVDSPYHISPEGVWDLGEIATAGPTRAHGTFSSAVYDSFSFTEEPRENPLVKLTSGAFHSDETGAHGAKSGYRIWVEACPDVPSGVLRETIKLKAVSGDKEQFVEFTVVGRRSGVIDVRGTTGGGVFNISTNRLIFPDFTASVGKTVKMTLFVKGLDGDLALNSVEPEDTRFKVRLLEGGKVLGKSKTYQLEVEIPPGPIVRHRDYDAESINLKLNHPEAPDFKLLLDYNAVR